MGEGLSAVTPVQRVAVVALTLFFIAVGVRGVDYGDQHWDEPSNVKQLVWALEHRAPFPRWYYYPSGLMMVLGAAAVPEVVTHGLDGAPAALMELPYRLRARALLIVLTSLAIPLTFLLARRAGCTPRAALFSAGLVATSFQLQTHARFIAPNAILVVAVAAFSLLLWRARADADRRALVLAALGSGVAAGIKYSAGIIAVPLAIAAWQLPASAPDAPSRRARAWSVVVCGAVSLLGFLLTTPGALFEPHYLVRGLEFQRAVYADGWVGYTVDGPGAMLKAMAGYLAFALLSPFHALACVLACAAVAGGVRLARSGSIGHAGLPWLAPILYAALFLTQRVFGDRNFLPLLPFAAVLTGLGLDALFVRASQRARSATGRAVVTGVVTAGLIGVFAVGAGFSLYAANTIPARHSDRFVQELSAYLDAHDEEELLASPRVLAALRAADGGSARTRGNLVTTPTPRTEGVLAYPDELHREWMWPCFDPFLVERVFGPLEVDWRYAPTWRGPPRIVLLDIDKARAISASLTFTPDEGPGRARMPMELLGR